MPAKKFTKADIIDALYEKTGMRHSEVRSALDLFLDEMKKALVRRQIIELRGFGTFEVKARKARPRARNPKTGENLDIRPHCAVTFRSGKELKKAVWSLSDDSP